MEREQNTFRIAAERSRGTIAALEMEVSQARATMETLREQCVKEIEHLKDAHQTALAAMEADYHAQMRARDAHRREALLRAQRDVQSLQAAHASM